MMISLYKNASIRMTLEKKYLKLSDLATEHIKRKKDAHKGSHGSLVVIGGQDGMLGALLLATRTALLCGAGRTYACAMASNVAPSVDIMYPEVMYRSFDKLPELASTIDAYVIGPGLGQSAQAIAWIMYCLQQPKPLLLDADALNLLAVHTFLAEAIKLRQAPTIITPHPGEASRLLNTDITHIQNNRIASVLALAKQVHGICVLKGAETICADADGHYWTNPTGNPGLASGGTGDVLSGLIGSLLAQGMPPIEAVKLGVYVHGAAADALVASGTGPIGLTASEVALKARQLLNIWCENTSI
ncbi:yjeF-like protein, hydroxyethylthiazole kinase-related [Methylophilaceae bacterium 11]|nr:yjeF-like protein, hydroxyethylthiazole kinase-related [Methylophilaceae bacterium 11]